MSYGIGNLVHNNLAGGGAYPGGPPIGSGIGMLPGQRAPLPGQPGYGNTSTSGPPMMTGPQLDGAAGTPVQHGVYAPVGPPHGGDYVPPGANPSQYPVGATGGVPYPGATQQQAPQMNANPFQPFYLPNPSMLNPTFMQGAQSNAQTSLDPNFMQSLGPQSTIQQILQGFAPQAQQSTNALNSQLAAMGVEGGPALDAQTRMQGQLASSLAPSLAQAIQNSQGNQLQGNEFGLQGGLQQALQNAGLQQETGRTNMQASNTANGINLGNILNQQQYNTQSANAGQSALAQAIQNAYYNNMNAFQNVNLAGLSGQQGVIQQGLGTAGNLANSTANNFPVFASSPYSGLGAAIGGAFNTPTSSTTNNYSAPAGQGVSYTPVPTNPSAPNPGNFG